MAFKVFVSHSAKDDPEAETLLTALSKRLDDEQFAPRIDREDLQFGQPWRQEINTWLTYCDAAVLLISPKALKSPFVAYEVSVLTHRKSRNPKFTILPILLGGVNFSNAEGNLLSPAQVLEIQPHFFTHDDLATTLQKVTDVLKAADAATIPPDTRTSEVIELLKKADAFKFRQALKTLKIDLGPWDPVADEYQSAATRLMSVGIEDAAIVIEQMKGNWTVEQIAKLYCLVACSWVDLRAADVFHEIVFGDPTKRNLALTATRPDLVELFGIRSLGQIPNDENERWWVTNVNAVFGELAVDELKGKIRRELSEVIGVDESQIPQVLASLLKYGSKKPEKPVVVSLQASAFPTAVMKELRAEFGGVTYFFLTGNRIRNTAVFESAGVEKIVPELHPDDEAAFADEYNENLIWLSPTSKGKTSSK